MTNISDEMKAALISRFHKRIYRADILADGKPVVTGLRISGGTVNVSSSQSPRRTCNLTVVDLNGDLTPGSPSDPLAPYGNEVAIYRGLRIASAGPALTYSDVLVPMCVCRINDAASSTSGGVTTISIDGDDRSARVSDDAFTDTFAIAAGTNAGTAIMSIISPALPASQLYSFTTVTQTIAAQTYAPGDNRWEKATALATDIGCILAFDPTGVCTLAPVTDPSTAHPAWVFEPGQSSVLTAASSSLTRANAKNYIVVTAQGSGITTPLQAVAFDNDPESPTYVGGDFGTVPAFVTTSTLTTQADVQNLANATLLLNKGATQQVNLSAIVLPHLDAFDVIETRIDAVKVAGRYVIDQLSIPLGSGTMSITTRGIVV